MPQASSVSRVASAFSTPFFCECGLGFLNSNCRVKGIKVKAIEGKQNEVIFASRRVILVYLVTEIGELKIVCTDASTIFRSVRHGQ